MLHDQHRSVPIISAYPCEVFYGGALVDKVCSSTPPINFPYASKPESMVFINVDAESEIEDGSSFRNPSEVDRVQGVIKGLLDGGEVKEEHIAVISPYLPQINAVSKQLRKDKIHVGTCLTIDGAQGNEYPYVILTLVRCNGTGKIGFLDDFRRLNVGITRAMKGLIIIGSQRTLLLRDSNNVWTRFFSFCAKKGLL